MNNSKNINNNAIQQLITSNNIKQMEKINEYIKKIDKKVLIENIIEPIHIKKEDNQDMKHKIQMIDSVYHKERIQLWKGRTNTPYKHIIRDADFTKPIRSANDLIIHKISDNDKHDVDKKLDIHLNDRKHHYDELQKLYNDSNKTEHKKRFEYNKLYNNLSTQETDDPKIDYIQYYKEEQKKIEKDKQNMDEIIESLLNVGLITNDDLIEIDKNQEKTTIVIDNNNGQKKGINKITKII